MNKLNTYNSKRNFNITYEPKGIIKKKQKKEKIFVIQHHYAKKKHYDLRFEKNNVLISFAVPKGLSYNPNDKRLAIKVEDHPYSYKDFEGVIPKGQYGAGKVMLWDEGTYEIIENKKMDFSKKILINIKGKRIQGLWMIIRFKENFLIIKEKDKYAKKSCGITKFKTSIKSGKTINEINDINIDITSPNKIIYPKDKITKLDIINYYNKIKDRAFPFLNNRLISVVRAPENINKEIFYMKHLNSKNNNLGIKKIKGKDYYFFKNKNGLLNEVNMNSYEFHIWLSQKNKINHPDLLIFDLDPGDKVKNESLVKVTLDLKKILDKLKLKSYIKTSGGKGYHIFVLLKTSSWSKTEKIAHDIANILYNQNPNIVTLNMSKIDRVGKIFIDYFRNKKGATCVMPYSLRVKNGATVSCPIKWNEINKIKPNDITIKNIDKRLKKKCPWNDFFN